MTSHRSGRIADLIRHELANVLREEVRDPRLGFVTVTSVDLSPDLRNARVFVTVLGQDEQQALRALKRATPFLRRSLAVRAGLRYTPELNFLFDSSVATGSRVEDLLREIDEDRGVQDEAEANDEGDAVDGGGDAE
jgi:ribosome-binding factor A